MSDIITYQYATPSSLIHHASNDELFLASMLNLDINNLFMGVFFGTQGFSVILLEYLKYIIPVRH
jgi:hypothetical protein